MNVVVANRQMAKNGAKMSAGREESGNTTVGGQDKRPRGAARLQGTVGALFSQAFSLSRRDVNHNCAARTRGNSAIPSTKITPRGTSGYDQRG